jgi:hypothetical protein
MVYVRITSAGARDTHLNAPFKTTSGIVDQPKRFSVIPAVIRSSASS